MIPEVLTFLTLLVEVSQMYKLPCLSMVTPLAELSHVLMAKPPSALLQHFELPATVSMTPWPRHCTLTSMSAALTSTNRIPISPPKIRPPRTCPHGTDFRLLKSFALAATRILHNKQS